MKTTKPGFLFLAFLILFVLSVYYLFDRMILNQEKFFSARYTDSAFVELMERLIDRNVFKIENGRVVIDENELNRNDLSAKLTGRVKRSLPFLYVKKGEIHFDRLSVSIVNNRVLKDDSVIRGRFLDRNGVVLAESHFDEKTWSEKREYIYGPEFYPLIGHANLVFGKRNLEKKLDAYLKGETHWPVYLKSSEPFKKLRIGDDVALTVDSKIQNRAYNLMKGKRGAVVVLDVKTGEILAAVSVPSFDMNSKDQAEWREAFMDNVEKPYLNRAFSGLYPPGSTFKTVVAAAWLEADLEDDLDRDHEVTCTGRKNKYRISDIHSHGKVDLDKAFAYSCNLFFSEIGAALGKNLSDYAERFGFNQGMDLLPHLKKISLDTEQSLAFSWYENEEGGRKRHSYTDRDYRRNKKIVAQCSIGQNLIAATPLQMVLVASTIANKGVLLNPYLVKEIRSGDGEKSLFTGKRDKRGRVLKKRTAKKIRKMMIRVMQDGTGKDVKKLYLDDGRYTVSLKRRNGDSTPIAGKTGTAEVGDRNGNGKIDVDERAHSWFIGFAPADDPKVAIAVIAENQGYGSLTAAPVAVNLLSVALNQRLIKK